MKAGTFEAQRFLNMVKTLTIFDNTTDKRPASYEIQNAAQRVFDSIKTGYITNPSNSYKLLKHISREYGYNEILRKQIPHDIYKSTMVLSDFNYDGDVDILYLTQDSIDSYFYLKSIEGEEKIFESNEFSHESMNHLSESKILFNDSLKFCIINKKRGFVIPYQIKNKQVITKFYYWSASEQSYILDESVTHEQIKNANCPEDYFAYNGLKFSKLDSKLIDSDLKDLDKAQLRLMRNAVYARHGRTFKSVDLQSLWECYTWYKKNPNYSDALLTDVDKYNIELIQKYESK